MTHKWHPGPAVGILAAQGALGFWIPASTHCRLPPGFFRAGFSSKARRLRFVNARPNRRRHRLFKPGRRWAAKSQPGLAAARRRRVDHHRRDQRRLDPFSWTMEARPCGSTAPPTPTLGIGEYPDIYRTFVNLIDERRSLVDVAPCGWWPIACSSAAGPPSIRLSCNGATSRPAHCALREPARETTPASRRRITMQDTLTAERVGADRAFEGNRLLSTFSTMIGH